jgi:ribosomal protein S27E
VRGLRSAVVAADPLEAGKKRRLAVTCPHCGHSFNTWTRRGLRVTCKSPTCGRVFEGPAGVTRLAEKLAAFQSKHKKPKKAAAPAAAPPARSAAPKATSQTPPPPAKPHSNGSPAPAPKPKPDLVSRIFFGVRDGGS